MCVGMSAESKIDFHCHVCGAETDIAPDPPEKAVCPKHCEDHKYIDAMLPCKVCEFCGDPIWEEIENEEGQL